MDPGIGFNLSQGNLTFINPTDIQGRTGLRKEKTDKKDRDICTRAVKAVILQPLPQKRHGGESPAGAASREDIEKIATGHREVSRTDRGAARKNVKRGKK